MNEARSMPNTIKEMEATYGTDTGPSKIFKALPYFRLAIIDLHTLNHYLSGEENEIRQKFLLRSIALTIFELSDNVHHVLGKEFRESVQSLPNHAEILAQLDILGKEFKKFEKNYLSDIK